jgi:hypothetical protein
LSWTAVFLFCWNRKACCLHAQFFFHCSGISQTFFDRACLGSQSSGSQSPAYTVPSYWLRSYIAKFLLGLASK